jgi:hypothetical protein
MVWWGIKTEDAFGFIGLIGISFLVFGAIHTIRMLRVAPVSKAGDP